MRGFLQVSVRFIEDYLKSPVDGGGITPADILAQFKETLGKLSLASITEALRTKLAREQRYKLFDTILEALHINEREPYYEVDTLYALLDKLYSTHEYKSQIEPLWQAIVEKESVARSLEALLKYILGGSEQDLKAYLDAKYGDDLEPLINHFFTSSHPNDEIFQLIKRLGIPYPIDGKEVSLYELLEEGVAQGHTQLAYLLELLDAKKERNKRLKQLAFLFCILALFVGLFLLFPSLPGLLDGFITTSASLLHNTGIAFVGIGESFLLCCYSIQQIYTNKRMNLCNQDRDIFFNVLKTFSYIAAYGIWLLLKSGMGPVITAIFIFSSLLDVAKEIYCTLKEQQEYELSCEWQKKDGYKFDKSKSENLDKLGKYNPWFNHHRPNQIHLRYQVAKEMHWSAIGINSGAAAAEIAITLCWAFFATGGLVVSAIAIVAFVLVYAIQHYQLQKNEMKYRVVFQERLGQLSKSEEHNDEEKTETKEPAIPTTLPSLLNQKQPEAVKKEQNPLPPTTYSSSSTSYFSPRRFFCCFFPIGQTHLVRTDPNSDHNQLPNF